MSPRKEKTDPEPVRISQVLHDRYEIIKKLGSGRYSTVWLVRDQEEVSYKAVKILTPDCYDGNHDLFELEILKHLRTADPHHLGYQHIPILLDDFVNEGQQGRHVCLVMELMAVDMNGFALFFDDIKNPNHIMKIITKQLLLALEYAHRSGVIYADIKQDIIMIKVRDPTIVNQYLKGIQSKTNPSLGVHNFDTRSELSDITIVLCDWGSASWEDKHLTPLIQPLLAPCPGIDIWNPSALLPELLDAVRMFDGRADVTGGKYYTKHHLEEIDALFGPFPSGMLEDGDQVVVQQFSDGKCQKPS
ncbi:putative serine-threonine protein kinase [Aspergillus ibericus CBS 121593]|uniref:non-specific serine/threonine protein kinase n=1 Tax=Aspergillus ibericus CBS 121593 TaxID=1448316 RepID=A0A395HE37_9EURO|nr:putative serine-threonine protein kinase [Aspergillus ibericus CBS 121593]RAL05375.1 putative serine-threonine protein kinase [Aspergillus ibericus CBS 121593]